MKFDWKKVFRFRNPMNDLRMIRDLWRSHKEWTHDSSHCISLQAKKDMHDPQKMKNMRKAIKQKHKLERQRKIPEGKGFGVVVDDDYNLDKDYYEL